MHSLDPTPDFALVLQQVGNWFDTNGTNIWVSLIAGLDSPLDHGTGLFDWNVGPECWTRMWDWNIVYRNTPAMHGRDRQLTLSCRVLVLVHAPKLTVPLPHFRFSTKYACNSLPRMPRMPETNSLASFSKIHRQG